MLRITILSVLLIATSCAEKPSLEALDQLNGYWEIERVVFPDGGSKQYSLSTTIDYFEYKDLSGFRKKVQPVLSGTFNTSDDAEFFKVYAKNDTFIIRYENDLSQWEEEIKTVNSEVLVLVNTEGISYHYKRFQGILPK